MPKSLAKTFEAPIERDNSPLKWVIVRIPFDAAKLWGKRGQIKVRGEINGFAFRTTLFPTGDGRHVLVVNKKMRSGGRTDLGVTARFRMEPDMEKNVLAMPAELEGLLREDKTLRRWYERELSNSRRNEIVKWVCGVKSAEARLRRAQQITERLLATMDAERDLPPMIAMAFARDRMAEEGWRKMPASHRRSHLMAVFYYQSPEARARRLAKVLAESRAYAEKRRKSEP
jgi:uncharacterized protein YdeI (YjbR/CyaY-like superfamily)